MCVEPQSLLIFVPSGSLEIISTSAPSLSKSSFAVTEELPFAQSMATLSPFKSVSMHEAT